MQEIVLLVLLVLLSIPYYARDSVYSYTDKTWQQMYTVFHAICSVLTHRGLPILIGVALLLLLQPAGAEMYQWKDSNGNVVFSDSPHSGVAAKEIKPKNRQKFDVPPQEAYVPIKRSDQEIGRKPASNRRIGDIRIIVYMTDWCHYCRKTREYLRSIDANFVECNIDTDKSKSSEMLNKSGGSRGVPLIDVEGTIIRGFNPDGIQAAIEKNLRG